MNDRMCFLFSYVNGHQPLYFRVPICIVSGVTISQVLGCITWTYTNNEV